MQHLQHIDGLRAVAVLAVMAFHANAAWLPGGFLGVDAFFVISGFVVTAAMARHRGVSIGEFIVGFYHRRLTRILPAVLVMLLVASLAWVLLIPRSWLSGQSERIGLFAFAGLSNWALQDQSDAYFAPRAEFSPFTHTWSLGVEEQFYLVAPWLIFFAWRRDRVVAALVGALSLLSLGLAALWTSTVQDQAFYSIASRFWELAAGALWYLLFWHRLASARWVQAAATATTSAVCGALLLALTLAFAPPSLAPFPAALGAVVGTVLLIGFPRGPWAAMAAVLSSRPFNWVGLRSYSLYLWHWPIFVMLRWTLGLETLPGLAVALAGSFAAAAASFRWIEQPLRRSARWQSLPHGLTTCTLVALAAVSAGLANQAFERKGDWSLATADRHQVDWPAPYVDPTLNGPECPGGGLAFRTVGNHTVVELHPCDGKNKVEEPSPGRRLFALGDSHATTYMPMLHRLSVTHGVQVFAHQIPGCPYVDLRKPVGQHRPPPCLSEPKLALQDVLARSRAGDVVLLASLRLPRVGNNWGLEDANEVLLKHFSAESDRDRDAAVPDTDDWLQPLLRKGLKLVITAPPPIFRSPPFRCVDPWTRHHPICAPGLSESREDELKVRAPVMATIQRVLDRQRGVGDMSVFDPFALLCPGERCQALDPDGRPLFFDGDHISRWANERLYPSFESHWKCVTTPGCTPAAATLADPPRHRMP